MNCKNCDREYVGKYCSNCGVPARPRKIDNQYFFNEIRDVFNLNKGFFFTTHKVLFPPGRSIRNFILEDRTKFTKPVVYLIITSLLFTIVTKLFHISNDSFIGSMMLGFINAMSESNNPASDAILSIYDWARNNYGYINLMLTAFTGFWTWIFFRKSHYNIYEIIILLCYISGALMLINSAIVLIQVTIKFDLLEFAWILNIAFTSWAIGQFFGGKKFVNYAYGFLAYILGFITFGIVFISTLLIVDALIN